MATQDFKRKLTTILHADVKDYSRLMSDDEDATVRTLTAYREVMGEFIQKHRGRVVHGSGDSLLAEFVSVVDAVRCAVEIQKELKTRNAELPEDRKVKFRMGINPGDVIEKDDDLHGDGVNIAARVEALAEGEGICITRTAYDHVKKKLNLGYEYLGEHTVKNIAEPVRVYRVLMDPEDAGKLIGEKSVEPEDAGKVIGEKSVEPEDAGKVIGEKRDEPRRGQKAALAVAIAVLLVIGGVVLWKSSQRTVSPPVEVASVEKMAFQLPDKPSIAVLPFDNLSEDPKQEYFSDGLTEEIITALSKVPKLFVIARNSTFTYKGKSVKINQVAQELGVRYVLEGSVRKAGDKIRITAQLIDALNGHHLWAERYDRGLKDIFVLQDDITKKIITAMQVKLTEGEQVQAAAKGTNNLEAYLKYLQANEYIHQNNPESNALGKQLAEEAITLDPEYAWAYFVLGRAHMVDVWVGASKSPKDSIAKAIELVQKAIVLDDTYAEAHGLLGFLYSMTREHDKAVAQAEKSVALNPNSAGAHFTVGKTLSFAGRWEESIPEYKKAIRLNPIPPNMYLWSLGLSYCWMGQYDEAIKWCEKAVGQQPDDILARVMIAVVYSLSGRNEEARVEAAEILRIQSKFTLEKFEKKLTYKRGVDREQFIDALRKAGIPDKPPLPLPDKPSIAVLPFENMSDDPKQEYFSDGITDDLITDLSKISGLFVIARNSTFTYKGKPVKVQQVAEDLGVRYVLEGSVRKAGEKIRLNAQLIDATTGHHLWAERYDGNLGDIFALQDRFTQKIVAALAVKLTAGEQERSAIKETISIDAYDAFLQGWEHYLRRTPDDFTKALPYFENAILLDPNYGRAYAALALTYLKASTYGWNSSLGDLYPTSRIRAQQYLENSMKNPTSVAHRVASEMALTRRKHQKAIAEAERAIAIDPNDAESHMIMAKVMLYVGRPEEAITSAKRAMLLDPRNIAFPLGLIGRAHFSTKQFEEVITLTERALKLKPSRTGFASTLAAAYAHLGHNQNARSALDIYTKPWLVPATLQRIMYFYPFKNPEDADLFADGLLKAGLPGKPSGYYKASEEHRLTGEEIKDLFFGHTMTGLWADRKWSISRTRDGKAALLLDSKVIASGKSWIEGDMLCHQWKKRWEGLKFYISIFRNPEGTPKEKNEYILITDWTMYGISIED